MIGRLVFITALLTAPLVSAQEPQAPPTGEQIAAAKAHARQVIAAAEAGAYFEDITTDATPTVRHRPSGLTCIFTVGDPRDNIRFYPAEAGGPAHGDDVSCGTWINNTFLSTFATRYPGRPSREAVFGGTMADVPRNTPGARLIEGDVASASTGDRPPPLAGGYRMQLSGRAVQSYVLVDHIGDWSFKARATGPEEDETVNLIGALFFSLSLPGAREAAAQ